MHLSNNKIVLLSKHGLFLPWLKITADPIQWYVLTWKVCQCLFYFHNYYSFFEFYPPIFYLSFIDFTGKPLSCITYLWGLQNISTLSNGLLFLLAFCRAFLFAAASLCLAAARCFTSKSLISSRDLCLVKGTLPNDDCRAKECLFVNDDLLVKSSPFSSLGDFTTQPFCLSSSMSSNVFETSSTLNK